MRKRDASDTELTENPPRRGDKSLQLAEIRQVVQEYIDDQRELLRKLRRILN
jgi:hypothetical protein